MAIKCLACGNTVSGTDGLHTLFKCPNPECGNTDRSKFCRVDDEDVNPVKHEKDKKWLESHKAK